MPKPPDQRSVEILADVLNHTCRSLKGMNVTDYRVDHDDDDDDLDRLDRLIDGSYLTIEVIEQQQTMRVGLRGLYFVDNEIRHDLVHDIDCVLGYLRDRYREARKSRAQKVPLQKALVRLSDISGELKIDRPRVELCVHYAKIVALLESTPDLADPDAYVDTTENLIGFRNLSHWFKTRASRVYPGLFEPPQKPHGNVETSAAKREVILGAALSVINKDPKKCRWGERLAGERIVAQIELDITRWWPDAEQAPKHSTMVTTINKYL